MVAPKRDPVAKHHVYVIELDPAVLEHARFRAENPDHDARKPTLYVGIVIFGCWLTMSRQSQ